jgi:transposase
VDFIGIDVHKKESQVCILAVEGEVIVEQRIQPSVRRPFLGRSLLPTTTRSEWESALAHWSADAMPCQ